MNAAVIALVTAFAVPLGNASLPPVPDDVAVEAADSQAPPEPTILDVAADEFLQPDGRRVRWTSVTYELSSGHEAEAFVEVDDRGRGDGFIYVDGEALMHVCVDDHGDTTTWAAPNVDLPPEALAQLMSADVATEVFAGIGDEALSGPCSESTKKLVRVAKYAWYGVIGAALGACCLGASAASGGAASVACGGLAGVAMGAGSDIADDYCA
jgi:hypothetical protein